MIQTVFKLCLCNYVTMCNNIVILDRFAIFVLNMYLFPVTFSHWRLDFAFKVLKDGSYIVKAAWLLVGKSCKFT